MDSFKEQINGYIMALERKLLAPDINPADRAKLEKELQIAIDLENANHLISNEDNVNG